MLGDEQMRGVKKQDIRELGLDHLKKFFLENGEKEYRAKQVYEWIWKKYTCSFADMTNLPKSTRELLSEKFEILCAKISDVRISRDKTIKTLFEFHDGEKAEGVLIPSGSRATACISTQVGCKLGCVFCATSRIKFKRNISAPEIYDQVCMIRQQAKDQYNLSLTNIVYMGMGEPLLNYSNIIRSAGIITSAEGLGFSPSRITVSTAGISKMIKRLGNDHVKFNLAVSLHSADDKKRSSIMPVNKTNNIDSLIDSLKYYYSKTNNRITIEYSLIKNLNDSIPDAKDLVTFCRNFPCKINIIDLNPVKGSKYTAASAERKKRFTEYLIKNKLIVNERRSRGQDIKAACGQLICSEKTSNKSQ